MQLKSQISVLGIGYIGMVQIVCFAKAGIPVIAYDNKEEKNELLRSKRSVIVEPGIQGDLEQSFSNITVAKDSREAVMASDIIYICVGTPSLPHGEVNLDILETVMSECGKHLKEREGYALFVVRSTIPPGTSKKMIALLEAESGKKCGTDFGYMAHPEFLREGSSIEDFMNPSFTIFGTDRKEDAEALEGLYRKAGIGGEFFMLPLEGAELFKYLNNNFHALKAAFANEVGEIGKRLGLDPVELMRIFVLDKKLNISPYYLRPGMPFGGYCLPKDARGIRWFLEKENITAPTIFSALQSNEQHIAFLHNELLEVLERIERDRVLNGIGVLGIAFKPGTDDIRESPSVRMFQFLLSRGFKARFFDSLVDRKLIVGGNLKYAESLIRNFFSYQVADIHAFIAESEVIVIGDCGNGLDLLIKEKESLQDKVIVALDPKFYKILEEEGISFIKVL